MPARKTPSKPASPRAKDAIALLTADHKEVRALFKQYDKLAGSAQPGAQKQQLAQQICGLLTVHATLEEELFYPAARQVLGKDGDLLDEAVVEHATAKDLIAQIEGAASADALFDAKVKVLGEYIDHHAKEEETEMFPKLRKTELDLKALGADMAGRKAELMEDVMAVEA
jgi:hemerythrin superfamily protein